MTSDEREDAQHDPPAHKVGGRTVVYEAKSVRLQHDSGKEVGPEECFLQVAVHALTARIATSTYAQICCDAQGSAKLANWPS
jgi:hypothetical protein